jgi:antitoxin YefM
MYTPPRVTCVHMSTHSLRDLRSNLGSVVRTVAATGEEVIVTDSGTEVAVIISMTDYERLHEHADVADALRLRDLRSRSFTAMTLAEMLDALDVDADAFAAR